MLPVLTLALFYDEKRKTTDRKQKDSAISDIGLRAGERISIALLLLIVTLLIWLSMYLAFSVVGAQSVDGVQMRYYLPLTFLLALGLQNQLIMIRVKRYVMLNILFMTCLVLNGAAVWELILQGRFL